jgi:D-glycero-beta-D-manno-heptose-7-phosphate kinase
MKARPLTQGNAPDLARLADLVDQFPRQTILVLGDFVADEFVFGEISRVSREAPVLILRHRETQILPGGGANAVNNLADLGAKVRPIAAVGDDAAGRALVAYFRAKKVPTSGLVRANGWQTPAKTRFLAGWPHTARQQVLRMDREPGPALPEPTAKALVAKARERLAGASAVLVSDYGYGSATPASLQAVRGRGRWPVPVALDSRYRLQEFAGLGLTAATPNEAELEAACHQRIGSDTGRLQHLAQQMAVRMGLRALVVTRGRDGMVVCERGSAPQSLSIFGSDQALDVTGAGDTVIAVLTLALAAGATISEAAQLANYAGGIVVMKRGTATVTREELSAAIRAEATGLPAAGSN